MADFEIITDTTADLYDGYYDENPTLRLPFSFTLEGVNYERDDLYPLEEFYLKLKEGHIVKTSQVNPYEAETAFDKVLSEGKDILFISFSSGMSGSYNTMEYIAKGLRLKYPERRIVTVDSLSGAGGEGLLVYYAKKLQAEGKSLDEIAKWLEDNRRNAHHIFIVDDLSNLRHSGRISTIAALLGMIVSIKPVLELTQQGKIGVLAKALGRKKATSEILRFFDASFKPETNDFILIGHTNCPEEAHAFGERIAALAPDTPIKYGNINRLVAGNAGYNALAVFFMGTERKTK